MLLQLLLCAVFVTSIKAAQFQIKNRDGGDIWVGILENRGKPALKNGGFVLHSNEQVSVDAPDDWAGQIWSRTWCDINSKHCQTGDCGNKLKCFGAEGAPPVTLVEITLKGSGGLDFYDISLADGFNSFATIQPLDGQGDGSQYSCKKCGCESRINNECPGELQLHGGNGNQVIGCKSACAAFNTDQYCCRGVHDKIKTCRSSNWPKDYPKFFKDRCPDAYSYAYDDHKKLFTCKASKYLIQLGG